jgi:hypothetical protein
MLESKRAKRKVKEHPNLPEKHEFSKNENKWYKIDDVIAPRPPD